jgi:hypothetical protein
MDALEAAALDGEQLKAFHAVLLDAYVNRDQLEMLVRWDLRKPPGTLEEGGLSTCAFRLILAAQSEGWLHELVDEVLKQRARNVRVKEWAKSVSPVTGNPGLPSSQRLLNTAYFDLEQLPKVVVHARRAAQGRVLGFGVTYPDDLFVRKLCDRLGSYLGKTQVKEPLNLMPEFAPVSKRLRHISRYRPELDLANVLCVVHAQGVQAATVAEFWQGVCREFDQVSRYLVLILTGHQDAVFPAGVTILPRPQFDVADVELWTREVAGLCGWPTELADAWTDLLCEKSMDEGVLDARYLYEAMEETIQAIRLTPERFRKELEKRIGYAHTPPA